MGVRGVVGVLQGIWGSWSVVCGEGLSHSLNSYDSPPAGPRGLSQPPPASAYVPESFQKDVVVEQGRRWGGVVGNQWLRGALGTKAFGTGGLRTGVANRPRLAGQTNPLRRLEFAAPRRRRCGVLVRRALLRVNSRSPAKARGGETTRSVHQSRADSQELDPGICCAQQFRYGIPVPLPRFSTWKHSTRRAKRSASGPGNEECAVCPRSQGRAQDPAPLV